MTSLRGFASPVPTQTVRWSFGSIASAPIDATPVASKTGDQVAPPFSVFQTPPRIARHPGDRRDASAGYRRSDQPQREPVVGRGRRGRRCRRR